MTEKIWSAEDYFNKAKEFEAQDKLDEAIYFYTEAIESDNGMKKAYFSRAEVFFQEKDYKNALIDYEYLDSLENDEKYLEKRAICYERMRDYGKSLELYVKLLLQDIEPEAYENIYRIVENHPQFKTQIDLKELDALLVKFSSEDKAIKFKKAASETDLDQRNDFLNLYLTLLPKNSSYLYEANIDKADAEVFRYRLCFDKAFREEIKQKERLTEKELNNKYKYNPESLSELNLVYATQKYNEATRYAVNLDQVNYLDNKVKQIVQLASAN